MRSNPIGNLVSVLCIGAQSVLQAVSAVQYPGGANPPTGLHGSRSVQQTTQTM